MSTDVLWRTFKLLLTNFVFLQKTLSFFSVFFFDWMLLWTPGWMINLVWWVVQWVVFVLRLNVRRNDELNACLVDVCFESVFVFGTKYLNESSCIHQLRLYWFLYQDTLKKLKKLQNFYVKVETIICWFCFS